MVAVAEAAQWQTTINQKAAAITADTVVAVETAAAVAVAAAISMVEMAEAAMGMAAMTAAMAAAMRQPWQCREGYQGTQKGILDFN
jgi:hypothetical protein